MNEPAIDVSANSVLTLTYSLVQEPFPGEGNIEEIPQFVQPDPSMPDWDLHLQPGSPGIDQGNTAGLLPDILDLDEDGDATEPTPLDLDGNPRVNGAAVDMGVYEAT